VCNGHAAEAARSCYGSKELIAQASRGIFQIPIVAARLASHVGPVRHKIKSKFSSKPANEQFVFVGLGAPKLMVKMQNEELDTEFRTQVR
jgi:dihydroxyacetone kinase DhaKLM complex PTS-EIIA-like component DhaM